MQLNAVNVHRRFLVGLLLLANTARAQHSWLDLGHLAVKTNLVCDAVLMPSLAAEYRLNERWSVGLEGDVAWWKNASKHKYYQLAAITPEVRYKLDPTQPWQGHYLGAFASYAWYDLANGRHDYYGEAGMAGVSYSYQWPISRCLSLEAGLGAGVMYTRYKELQPLDGHYIYRQTSHMFYAGPLKLQFSLVWRLGGQDDKEGGRP